MPVHLIVRGNPFPCVPILYFVCFAVHTESLWLCRQPYKYTGLTCVVGVPLSTL